MLFSEQEPETMTEEELLQLVSDNVVARDQPIYVGFSENKTILSYSRAGVVAQVSMDEKGDINFDAVMISLDSEHMACLNTDGDYFISNGCESYLLSSERDKDAVFGVKRKIMDAMKTIDVSCTDKSETFVKADLPQQ